ncbi:hypothetical protein PR048_023071, partial [Dryococelus australis]
MEQHRNVRMGGMGDSQVNLQIDWIFHRKLNLVHLSGRRILTCGESRYSIVSCLGNDRTNSAFTVSIDVISFGSSARLVSLRYCKNTSPESKPRLFHCKIRRSSGPVGRVLTSHHGDLGSIPGESTSGFPHVGIVLDDVTCQRVFSGYSRFPCPCIPAPLHPRVSFHVMSGDDGHLRVPAIKPGTRRVLPRPGR